MTTVAKPSALNHPNGIAVLPNGTLVVVTFSVPGELSQRAGAPRSMV